jgi:beta propeller repeat protein
MKRRPLQLFVWFIFLGIFLFPPAQLNAASSYADLANEFEFAVVINSARQMPPAISDDIIVWADDRNGNSDIYDKNLSTGQE